MCKKYLGTGKSSENVVAVRGRTYIRRGKRCVELDMKTLQYRRARQDIRATLFTLDTV
jgi:hypothetical protein